MFGVTDFDSPDMVLNVMWFRLFQRRSQLSDAWKFLTFSCLAKAIPFFWIIAADNGTF